MKRILTIVGLLTALIVLGTFGFHFIEGSSWLDSLYMAVITLTTLGMNDVIGLSDYGKVFLIVFSLMGLGAFTYGIFQLGQWIITAELRSLWEKQRMDRSIHKLTNHFIICGCGRMGETICSYLQERKRQFVVIDVSEERLMGLCEQRGWLNILGDATDDDVLKMAGIDRARSLATVLPTDADNVYIVLGARMLNPNIQIVARATEERAAQKMERAGANRVISPINSGAVRIARFMLYPSVEDFLEIADTRSADLELVDVQVPEESPYIGKQLAETDLRQKGIMVIGIRRANGERLMPPPGTAVLQAGDSLFAFGSGQSVEGMVAGIDGV